MRIQLKKIRLAPSLLRTVLALAIAFLVSQFRFDYVEALFYDARVRLKPAAPTSGAIELIAVDPTTVEALGRVPSASDHLRLLQNLRAAEPLAVVYLLNPNDFVGSLTELENLASEMASFKNFHVGIQDVALKGESGAFTLLPPFSKISALSGPTTADRSIFAGDNVTRRMMLSYQGQTSLYPQIAGLLNQTINTESSIRGVFEYLSSNQAYIDFRPTGTYPMGSFVDVMTGSRSGRESSRGPEIGSATRSALRSNGGASEASVKSIAKTMESAPDGTSVGHSNGGHSNGGHSNGPSDGTSGSAPGSWAQRERIRKKYQNKIVLVGRDTQTTTRDYVLTPFKRDVVAMTVLELNANMLDTLIQNSAPIRSPRWLDLILTALISILTVYVVLAVKPTRGLAILGATLLAFLAVAHLAFWLGGFWIAMAHPFVAVFVCYYLFIPYRLIIENRRSWEYYQKNRLLTQVEELKTNFLSMMSHDLKTPIARIQGMTDIVRNDSNGLSPRQREALDTLSKSTQELLDFVSSILNLGRIESKEIKLHFVSRDPNGLLSEVIEKLEYMAKARSITIHAELEPMFSLKMDVDLMRQVLTNLIENAIKYSPDHSRVLVTSEERNGKVVIQVADQGVGIPEEELQHVFGKFYRSRNAKKSNIKGSGLGLYLAKYFLELHKGSISVESRVGEGSTFTIELPTETSPSASQSSAKNTVRVEHHSQFSFQQHSRDLNQSDVQRGKDNSRGEIHA